MLHLGWVPLAPQTSNPPRGGLMNLLRVRTKQRTNKTRRKHWLPWAANCPKHVNQSQQLAQIHFSRLTKELLVAHENMPLLGIILTYRVPSTSGTASLYFAPAVGEHWRLYFLLRTVTWGTMSRGLAGLPRGSPCRVSAVIESGPLLPTEEGCEWIVSDSL